MWELYAHSTAAGMTMRGDWCEESARQEGGGWGGKIRGDKRRARPCRERRAVAARAAPAPLLPLPGIDPIERERWHSSMHDWGRPAGR